MFRKKYKGSVAIMLVVIGLLVLAIIAIVFVFAYIGDRMGAMSGSGMITGNKVDCSGVASLSADQYQWVKDAASKYLGGDEAALIALIQVESGWSPNAVNSSSSAAGLGQFITKTARGFPEFVGGDDKHGIAWPAGQVYDDPSSNSSDARFDQKRSIYATAHLLGGMIQKYGSLGDAYEYGYHTHGNGDAATVAAAQQARKKLEDIYNSLKTKGCTQVGGTGNSSGQGCGNVPIFKQCDSQWGSNSYACGGTSICSSGCGITSAAMVLKFYGKNVDPATMAQDAMANGGRVSCIGTDHNWFPKVAKEYGLQDENNISWDRAMTLLKQGKPIIVSGQGPRPFSSGGHFIVLTCYNSDGTIAVNDPAHTDTNYSESLLKQYQHFITAMYP